jgi:hypothetical protein
MQGPNSAYSCISDAFSLIALPDKGVECHQSEHLDVREAHSFNKGAHSTGKFGHRTLRRREAATNFAERTLATPQSPTAET